MQVMFYQNVETQLAEVNHVKKTPLKRQNCNEKF